MKKILFVMLLSTAITGALQAQIRKVPAEVTNSLKTKYPNATNVEWKDRLTGFDATFKNGSDDMTVSYNNKGEWTKTEKGISASETPAAVMDGFKKSKYSSPSDWKMGDVVTVITKEDKSTQYRVYVDKVDGIQKKYLFFAPSGKLERESLTL